MLLRIHFATRKKKSKLGNLSIIHSDKMTCFMMTGNIYLSNADRKMTSD